MKRALVISLGLAAGLAASAGRAQTFEPRARVSADYVWVAGDGAERNEFRLGGAELGARLAGADVLALDVQVDAVRSASPESLFGIDGNALVMVLARAYGEVAPRLGPGRLTLRLGLVPDPVVQAIEGAYRLRVVRDVLADTGDFHPRSDLGLSVSWALPDQRLGLVLAATNGEGGRDVERDAGKDLLVMAHADPWAGVLWGSDARLRVMAAYRSGTRGTSGVQADRLSGLVAFVSPRLAGGFEAHLARGYAGRGERDASGVGAWLFGAPWPALGFAARADWLVLDDDVPDSDLVVVDAAVVLDVGALVAPDLAAPRLRLRVGWRGQRVSAGAAVVPGQPATSDADVFVVTLEGQLGPE